MSEENIFEDPSMSETTRFEILRNVQSNTGGKEESPDSRKILLSLYQNEKSKVREIERRLGHHESQALKYANDLTQIYKEAKDSRRQLAEANSQMRKYAVDLRTTIASLKQSNEKLEQAYYDTVRRLVIAAEFKDMDTGNHITRISRYSALIAEKIGMPPDDVRTILYASPMHDIGKIGIPDKILLKTEKLNETEFETMKMHTLIGFNILSDSNAKVLQWAQQIALFHHEKFNGGGYPQGVSKYEIPLHARIVSLVDSFDALSSKRPYKEAYPIDVCCDIIHSERGKHFDTELVDVFLDNIDEIRRIHDENSDSTKSKRDYFMTMRNKEMERLTQLYR